MSILLPDLHPLIIKEKDVQGLCSDLFQSNPLHYFSLIRCYKDGSFFPLGTHAHFMMEWFRTLPLKFPYHDHYAYKQRYTFQRKEGYSYFTSREILCLHMLEEGKSYKYISSIFDVSPRTIETYISRAKKRTDMYNVQDMMNILRLS